MYVPWFKKKKKKKKKKKLYFNFPLLQKLRYLAKRKHVIYGIINGAHFLSWHATTVSTLLTPSSRAAEQIEAS